MKHKHPYLKKIGMHLCQISNNWMKTYYAAACKHKPTTIRTTLTVRVVLKKTEYIYL